MTKNEAKNDGDNTIRWTVQPPGVNQPVEVILRPFALEEQPPEGYSRLVTIERAAVLEGQVLDQIRAKLGGNDGIIRAAMFLEEQLGGTLPRRRCIRVVKDMTRPEAQSKKQFAILLQGSYWVSEEDGVKIERMRGVFTHGKEGPRIEAEIEWPDNVPETSDLDSELSHPPQQNRVIAPPRDALPVRPMAPNDPGAKRPHTSASIKKLPPGGRQR